MTYLSVIAATVLLTWTTAMGGRFEDSAKRAQAAIAEEAKMIEQLYWCLQITEGILEPKQTAEECFDYTQRTFQETELVCRRLIGRLSSFEVCVEGGKVVQP